MLTSKIMPRIFVQKLTNDQMIFGALNFNPTEFKGHVIKNGKLFYMFSDIKHGEVICDRLALYRIKQRFAVNGLKNQALEIACYNDHKRVTIH